MPKNRGGLGRGLDSLLGGDYGESFGHEKQAPHRVQVNKAPHPEPAVPVVKKGEEKPAETVARGELEDPNIPDEDLYSARQDHITIKGVVERAVEKKPEPVPELEQEIGEKSEQPPKVSDEVPIDEVHPNENQPRMNFKQEELEELADSIRRDGLLQPILVRKLGEHDYQIIAGERRWKACKKIGLEKVPIRIKDADDEKALMLALIENVQRSDLNPIEEAYGYRRMMEHGNMTQSEVAQAVSKGRSTVANALRLLELPEDAQQLLYEDKITAGHARAILSIPSEEGKQKLTEKLKNEKLSVRETEAIARLLSGKKNSTPSTRQPTPKSFKTVARALRERFNTNVKVRSVKGKNKIEIEFKDEDDLERIFEELTESVVTESEAL